MFALILWTSALGLLIVEFHLFLTELSARDTSIFSFLNDNFTKYQWIFTKLGVCIDIVDICLGMLMVKFRLILIELSAWHTSIFYFPDNNLSKSQWICSPN